MSEPRNLPTLIGKTLHQGLLAAIGIVATVAEAGPKVFTTLVEKGEARQLHSRRQQPAAEPVAAEPADKLERLEGIGPKIAALLRGAEIASFAELAAADVAHLRRILDAAGGNYRLADPTSWPDQAALAAAGNWSELKQLQDELKGSR